MTVAAYVRVSSRSQNLATQRDAILKLAAARGDVIAHWFEEKKSARKLDRPALASVRELVRAGEISRIYLFRLDRLSRSGIRDTMAVVEEFRKVNCEIVTVNDGFSFDGPAADVVIAVMAWAAQMERLAIGERISAARARIEASGGKWGKPKRVRPIDVERIRKRVAKNESIRKIAMALKIPRSTVGAVVSEKGAYAPAAPKSKKRASNRREPPPSE